jgi:hypothetical protein
MNKKLKISNKSYKIKIMVKIQNKQLILMKVKIFHIIKTNYKK